MTEPPFSFEQQLLGGPAKYTRAQVAEKMGIEAGRGLKLWIAMGFSADPEGDAVMFTDADVDALATIIGLTEAGIIDEAMEVAIARTLGQSMSRIAEWQVGVVNGYIVEKVHRAEVAGSTVDIDGIRHDARLLASEMVPVLERLQNYAWRRHLAAVAGRSVPVEADSAHEVVIGFADMVGYTTITRNLSIIELTALIEEFEAVATEIIAQGHGSVVKTVGDEVMFEAPSALEGARIALALQEAFSAHERLPALRIGVAVGPALARFGDLYGAVVNIAARLTSAALAGTVLVDDTMAEVLRDSDEFRLKFIRPLRVRGYKRLKAFVLRRPSDGGDGNEGGGGDEGGDGDDAAAPDPSEIDP